MKKKKPKSKQQARELVSKIKASILDGDSFRARVAKNLAMPIISVANDGVLFKPAWQDDFLPDPTPEQLKELTEIIEAKRLARTLARKEAETAGRFSDDGGVMRWW